MVGDIFQVRCSEKILASLIKQARPSHRRSYDGPISNDKASQWQWMLQLSIRSRVLCVRVFVRARSLTGGQQQNPLRPPPNHPSSNPSARGTATIWKRRGTSIAQAAGAQAAALPRTRVFPETPSLAPLTFLSQCAV